MAEYTHIVQPFEPVYDEHSKILILGSLPSVKSRENGFYYGHPQNRFWKVLAAVIGCDEPLGTEDKKKMLLQHHIALWDVIQECDIIGSSDSSIKNAVVSDISGLLEESDIQFIYVNGKTAEKYYKKYIEKNVCIKAVVLPSTSPANAAFSLSELISIWKELLIVQTGHYHYHLDVDYKDYVDILSTSHMGRDKQADYAFIWRDLFSNQVQIKQKVSVWYQVDLSKTQTVVMTLGSFYDDRIYEYEEKEELFKAYAVECFAMGLLRKAYESFSQAHLKNTGLGALGMQFLSENELKILPGLFERLFITEVVINDSLLLIPQKTVVFTTRVLDGCKAHAKTFYEQGSNHRPFVHTAICEQCTNVNCENRQTTECNSRTGEIDSDIRKKVEKRKIANDIKIDNRNLNYGYQRIMRKKEDET